jgi:hypothetical protein
MPYIPAQDRAGIFVGVEVVTPRSLRLWRQLDDGTRESGVIGWTDPIDDAAEIAATLAPLVGSPMAVVFGAAARPPEAPA